MDHLIRFARFSLGATASIVMGKERPPDRPPIEQPSGRPSRQVPATVVEMSRFAKNGTKAPNRFDWRADELNAHQVTAFPPRDVLE
jgi:hypothetical protein